MLVRPHAKVVLREAIESDSDFLSNSNIMDYSWVPSSSLCITTALNTRDTIDSYLVLTKNKNRSYVVLWILLVRVHSIIIIVSLCLSLVVLMVI